MQTFANAKCGSGKTRTDEEHINNDSLRVSMPGLVWLGPGTAYRHSHGIRTAPCPLGWNHIGVVWRIHIQPPATMADNELCERRKYRLLRFWRRIDLTICQFFRVEEAKNRGGPFTDYAAPQHRQ